jgi:hypothetical protein
MLRKFNKLLLAITVSIFSFGVVFADPNSYSAYSIGQTLGKVSHKSFDAMQQELVKQDFIAGLDDTMLDQKPDVDKITDEDSYEVGMIIATQYKANLKKIIKVDKQNCAEFVKGFNNTVNSKSNSLTTQDKDILKYFKITDHDE